MQSTNVTLLPSPPRFNELDAAAFVEHAVQVLYVSRLIVDLRPLTWVAPFGTLLVATGLRHVFQERKRKGLATKFVPDPSETLSGALGYLRAFGFYDYILREREGYRASLKGGETYLPITRVSLNKIESVDEPMQESVETYSDRLASILFPEAPGAQMMLGYCFREIIRNAFEHGDVEECTVMAQRWNKQAEIAIADAGTGIHNTISPVHNSSSPEDSIRLALVPGIRGLTANVDTGRYQNTGFGLYVVSAVGAQYGEFSLQSSERLLIRRPDAGDKWVNVRGIGTCVKLKANLEDGDYWPNILNRIVLQGEELAKEIPQAVKEASGASKSTRLKQSRNSDAR